MLNSTLLKLRKLTTLLILYGVLIGPNNINAGTIFGQSVNIDDSQTRDATTINGIARAQWFKQLKIDPKQALSRSSKDWTNAFSRMGNNPDSDLFVAHLLESDMIYMKNFDLAHAEELFSPLVDLQINRSDSELNGPDAPGDTKNDRVILNPATRKIIVDAYADIIGKKGNLYRRRF